MHKILVIAKRDFLAVIRTKAFIISLVAGPLLCVASYLPVVLQERRPDVAAKRIAVVDRTSLAGPAVIDALKKQNERDLFDKTSGLQIMPRFQFENIPSDNSDPAQQRLTLSDRVRRRELYAFVEIEPSALDPAPPGHAGAGASIDWYAGEGGLDSTQEWIATAVNDGLRETRLVRSGVAAGHLPEMLAPLPIEKMSLVARDERTGKIGAPQKRGKLEFMAPFVVVTLLLLIVMLTSAPMLTAISEDKMQRVFEMLLASATPFQLIAGKVLAAVGRSLAGAVVVVAAGVAVLYLVAAIGLAPLQILPWFFVYLVAEVTILAALASALGAACSTPADASSFSWFLIMPVMIPFFVLFRMVNEPNGSLATGMSFFPLFTPIAMLARQASPGGVPAWQPWLGLAGMAVAVVAISWVAARIFRVGILLQGKTPQVAELLRWALRG